MEVDFVPYQEALELHNLGAIFLNVGFPHLAIYRNGDLSFANQAAIKMFVEDFKDEVVVAPLYQQAFRWFRGNYKLSCSVELTDNSRHYYFDFTIYDSENRDYNDKDLFDSCKRIYDDAKYDTYEEAELACLRKLIEIVKSKQ